MILKYIPDCKGVLYVYTRNHNNCKDNEYKSISLGISFQQDSIGKYHFIIMLWNWYVEFWYLSYKEMFSKEIKNETN